MSKLPFLPRALVLYALFFGGLTASGFYAEPHQAAQAPAVDTVQLLRQEVLANAEALLGTPYRSGGKDSRGFDCSGFTAYVMRQSGVKLSASSRTQALQGQARPLEEAQPGDLVFFKRTAKSAIFHVALVLSNDSIGVQAIHSTSRGVVVDNISHSKYWQPKVCAVRDVLARDVP